MSKKGQNINMAWVQNCLNCNLTESSHLIKKVEQAERTKGQETDFGAAPLNRKRIYREVENRLCWSKELLNKGLNTRSNSLGALGPCHLDSDVKEYTVDIYVLTQKQ